MKMNDNMNDNITGKIKVDWKLIGPAVDEGKLEISSSTKDKCNVRRLDTSFVDLTAQLEMKMTKEVDGSTVMILTKDLLLPNFIAVSRDTNPLVMDVLYNQGFCDNPDYMTVYESEVITFSQLGNVFKGTGITSFNELKYFTALTRLPDECFSGCTSLTSIEIPPNVESFGNECFSGCTELATIINDNPLTSLGNQCFSGCMKLVGFSIPSTVTEIGEGCFRNCYKITELVIPSGVTNLGDVTFYDCRALTSISLPEGLITMGNNCLGKCSSLTEITIPSTVIRLSNQCFSGCVNVSRLNSKPLIAPFVSDGTFGNNSATYLGSNKSNCKLIVPIGSTGYDESYWLDPLCNISKANFKLEVAFTAVTCTNLVITAEDVKSDDTTTLISWIATVTGTNDLTGATVTGIKQTGTATSAPFAKNTSETDSVNRTITFTYLGKTATTSISQAPIKLIVFEDPEVGRVLKSKGLIANAGHSSEGELGLITSLDAIFQNNKVLTKFPELKYCTKITNLAYKFQGCSSLTSVPVIPSSVTNLSGTFQFCSSLTTAPVIPSSVTRLYRTFQGCSSLTKAPVIPEDVTDMYETFNGCSKLNGIYVIKPLTPPTYSNSLTNVAYIYVPDESVDLYKAASGWTEFADKIYPLSTKP